MRSSDSCRQSYLASIWQVTTGVMLTSAYLEACHFSNRAIWKVSCLEYLKFLVYADPANYIIKDKGSTVALSLDAPGPSL